MLLKQQNTIDNVVLIAYDGYRNNRDNTKQAGRRSYEENEVPEMFKRCARR